MGPFCPGVSIKIKSIVGLPFLFVEEVVRWSVLKGGDSPNRHGLQVGRM